MRNSEKEDNSTVYRKVRRSEVAREKRECSRCPPHAGENEGRRPKRDRHKNKDRKSVRKVQ